MVIVKVYVSSPGTHTAYNVGLALRQFDFVNATCYDIQGLNNGVIEKGFMIELLVIDNFNREKIERLRQWLCEQFQQKHVLIITQDVDVLKPLPPKPASPLDTFKRKRQEIIGSLMNCRDLTLAQREALKEVMVNHLNDIHYALEQQNASDAR